MNDRYTAMQTYVRAVEGGSLSAAARELGRSLAAVSRTISELESRLGVRLLHRSTRRLTPTEAGLAYHDAARRILAEIDEAETGIGAGRTAPRGLLTITAPLMFGRLHVAPLLNAYLADNDSVTAQLTLTDRNVNLIEEGIDIAVRIGRLADSSLVARPLGDIAQIACASPRYLKRRGTPATPEALKDHACIRVTSLSASREWTFRRDGRDVRGAVGGQFTCNVVDPRSMPRSPGTASSGCCRTRRRRARVRRADPRLAALRAAAAAGFGAVPVAAPAGGARPGLPRRARWRDPARACTFGCQILTQIKVLSFRVHTRLR